MFLTLREGIASGKPFDLYRPPEKLDGVSTEEILVLRDILLRKQSLRHSMEFLPDFIFFGDLIKCHPNLHEFRLTVGNNTEGIEYISECLKVNTTLQSLTLEKSGSASEINLEKIIEAIIHIESLTNINLAIPYQLGEEKSLPILLQKQNIKKLTFQPVYADPNHLLFFPEDIQYQIATLLANNKSITHLQIDNLATHAFQLINFALRSNTTLKSLTIRNSNISIEGMTYLCDGLRSNSTLEEIYLPHQSPDESNQIFAVSLANDGCKIRKANLTHLKIGINTATVLHDSLKTNSFLKILDLTACGLDPPSVRLICEGLIDHPNIEVLIMHANNIGFLGTQAITKLLLNKKTKLKQLNLAGSNLTENCFIELAKGLKYNSSLIQLDISSNRFNTRACQVLCDSLKTNKTLTRLEMRYPESPDEINIDTIRYIKEMLIHNDSLTWLDISDWIWTVENFDLFCEGLKFNQSITTLYAYEVTLEESDLTKKFLEVLQHNYALSAINVNFATDDEIKLCLKRNTNLKSEMAYNVAIISHNIARGQSALDLLPKELWISILKHIKHPGMNSLGPLIDNIFKRYTH